MYRHAAWATGDLHPAGNFYTNVLASVSEKRVTGAAHWNTVYKKSMHTYSSAVEVLFEFAHLLPENGTALDYACGLGRNAFFLAARNLQVSAWDYSVEALKNLDEIAREKHLVIQTKCIDLEDNAFVFDHGFDVIVVSHYLYREKFPEIINGLNSDGLLFYQTFTREKINSQGPENPNYLLDSGELLRLCANMNVLVYREEGKQGNISMGLRNQAYIIARKE